MPDSSELNLDTILGREKQPKLSQLDPGFFDTVLKQIRELESEKNGAEPDGKDGDITELPEILKVQIRDIMNVRMYKLIRMASSQSAKRDKTDPPVMTHEELKFYTALLCLMTAWRQKCLDMVFGRKRVKKETAVVPVIQKEHKKDTRTDFILLRLLRNVPTFVGMDERNYTLAKEDVVTLPAVNARALIMRKAAVQIIMK